MQSCSYVAELFFFMTSGGLGPWVEQTVQSVHHDLKETWKRYKVNDIDQPIYGESLLKVVLVYNIQHI